MDFLKSLFKFGSSILMLATPLSTQAAVHSKNFQYSSYLRAGSGTNLHGRDQVCFNNPGASTNEFRLGNECSIYGEIALTAQHLEQAEDKPYFLTQIRLAFWPNGHQGYEETEIQVVEAYAEGGRLIEGSDIGFWAGKRFYRDVDVYMYDWYYFAQSSGNGGGITNIKPGIGRVDVGVFFQTGEETASRGARQLQWLDLRWFDIKLSESHSLNYWGAFGQSNGGSITNEDNSVTTLDDGMGWLSALRLRSGFDKGFNDLTLAWGNGLLNEFTIYAKPGEVGAINDQSSATRLRLIEHLTYQPSARLAFHFATAYEYRYDGNPAEELESWASAGLRPVYFFNDHFQLATEVGHSIVIRDNQDNRTLTRIAIAPQISAAKNIWARPTLRLFYAYSFWNEANKGQVGGDAYADQTEGHALGFQTEVWF